MFLRSTHQIPIFRFRDGFEAMRNNEKSIGEAFNALLENKAIIMFVEGSTNSARKLRAFQKGLSRMTKDFELEHPNANLGILPVTINFSDPNTVGSSVTVQVFDVVEPKDFNFKNDSTNAPLTRLTKSLHATMKDGVFHLENNKHEELFNKLIAKMPHKQFPDFLPKLVYTEELLQRGKNLISALNAEENLQDLEIVAATKASFLGENSFSGFEKFLYYLLAPFALLGYIINFLPLKAAYNFSKAKVKKPIFFTSVLIALVVGAYFLYSIAIIIFTLLFNLPLLVVLLGVFLFSFLYVYFLFLQDKKQAAEDFSRMDMKQKTAYLNTQKIMEHGIT